MVQVFEIFSRFQGVRGQLIRLPAWARVMIFIAALPGVALIALSLLALLVSILALLLLTVPLYLVLKALTGTTVPANEQQPTSASDPFGGFAASDGLTSPGRKKVDVTIVE